MRVIGLIVKTERIARPTDEVVLLLKEEMVCLFSWYVFLIEVLVSSSW